MLVKVTEDHLRIGVRENPSMCPIAFAVVDAEPTATRIIVGTDSVFVYDANRKCHIFELPQVARDFISLFDQLGTALPIDFEMKKVI